MPDLLPPQRDLIDGEWQIPAHVLDGPLRDPNTGDFLQDRSESAHETVDYAIGVADELHRRGDWRRLTDSARAEALQRFAAEVEKLAASAAVPESLNTGLPISVAGNMAGGMPWLIRAAAEELMTGVNHQTVSGKVAPVELHREPWGPAAVILPWNAPSPNAAGKIGAALAAGCPVILKASEWAPSSAEFIAQAARSAGLPAAAFQLVHGGAAVGSQLAEDPRVRAIAFTGGRVAGANIARAGAATFKALQLELGGNSPAIVRADADLELTANALAAGMVKLNGQWCERPGKILVHERVAADLEQALLTRLAQLPIGHSLDETTMIGPQAFRAQRDRVQAHIDRLVAAGGHAQSVGVLPDLPGWFLRPTVITMVASAAADAEIFGPVITVHPVADDDEALLLANDGDGGLAGYVFTSDIAAGRAIAREIQAGEVKINGTSLFDLGDQSHQSFWGLSGIGGHGTGALLRFFTGDRVVGVDDPSAPI